MGHEAEEVILAVGPLALGWPLTAWMLHGDEDDVTATPTYTQRPSVQYDLLYSNDPPLIDATLSANHLQISLGERKNSRCDGSAIRMHTSSSSQRLADRVHSTSVAHQATRSHSRVCTASLKMEIESSDTRSGHDSSRLKADADAEGDMQVSSSSY
jgi:hypothetical protein